MSVELSILIALIFVTLYVLVRNQNVYEVRIAILFNDGIRSGRYDALPSYEAMIFNPRFLHMWTNAQWVSYASERVAK